MSRFSEAPEARLGLRVKSDDDPLCNDGPNVVRDFGRSPKRISSVYVYDSRGADLFEKQCDTPEYYLRRAETGLLKAHVDEIFRHCGLVSIVELGAGTAQKTRILLEQYERHGVECAYFPIDVDVDTLAKMAAALVPDYPTLSVHCLATTYERALSELADWPDRRLFLFLGSSIGNMELPEIDKLLAALFRAGHDGDHLLIGADLDKDPEIIDRAYNDAAGYGARSTLNMLSHLNWRYGGDFREAAFRYRSKYNPSLRRNEVHIESLVDQQVTLRKLNFTVPFAKSELIEAEVMWKFRAGDLAAKLSAAGFSAVRRWVEPRYQYGLFLFRHA